MCDNVRNKWSDVSAILILSLFVVTCSSPANHSQIWYIEDAPNAPGEPEGLHGEIRTINAFTHEERVVIQGTPNYSIEKAGLAPDGQKIAYLRSGGGGGRAVWIANADGSNVIQVTRGFSQTEFVWLDNRRLVIAGADDGSTPAEQGQWLLYDLSIRQLRSLVPEREIVLGCPPRRAGFEANHFMLDSRMPSFGHLELRGESLLLVTDIQVRGASYHGLCEASLSAGLLVAFDGDSGPQNGEVFLASRGRESVQQLTRFIDNYGQSSMNSITLSPDGRWVVFCAYLSSPHTPNLPQGLQVGLASAEGREVNLLKETFNGLWEPPVWSSDSRYAAVSFVPVTVDREKAGTEIYVIEAETNKISQVTSDGRSKLVFDWR